MPSPGLVRPAPVVNSPWRTVVRAQRLAFMESLSLFERARAGSPSALGKLLEQFRPLIYQRAAQSLDERWQARADQSDLAQITLSTAAHAFVAFRGGSEPELAAWLLAILQQHALAMTRRHLLTDKRSVGRESPLPPDDSQGGWQPAQSGPTPSRLAFRGEMRTRIEDAIKALPFDQREAVRLRFLDEWSTEQIAQFLDKSKRAVAGLIRRGLSQLRGMLHDLE
jgi:RNA polymerase sigma-70 factor, ECF subfamily